MTHARARLSTRRERDGLSWTAARDRHADVEASSLDVAAVPAQGHSFGELAVVPEERTESAETQQAATVEATPVASPLLQRAPAPDAPDTSGPPPSTPGAGSDTPPADPLKGGSAASGSTTITVAASTRSVSAGTLSELWDGLTRSGTREAASVQPKLTPPPQYEYSTDDRVTKATVTVVEQKEMPAWQEADKQCPPIKNEWTRVLGVLETHENKHVDIDKTRYADAHLKLVGKKREDAWAAMDTVVAAADAANQAYDTQSQNGVGEGAKINAAVQCAPEKVKSSTDGGPMPKLTVGAVDDPFEREADAAAEHVMQQCSGPGRCECEDCKEKAEALPGPNGIVRRHAEADGVSSAGGALSDGALEQVDAALRGGGRPLADDARANMETHLGYDFSRVRIHDDAPAAASAARLHARAFTVGSDVVFGAGQFSPYTADGRRLLAHELTHVVQQRAAQPQVQRGILPGAIRNDEGTPEQIANAIESKDHADVKAINEPEDNAPEGESEEIVRGRKIQRQALSGGTSRDGLSVAEAATRTAGQPLDEATGAFMEQRFHFDFSHVRVHADDIAAKAARSVNARAYTVGAHVVFGSAQYNPWDAAGRRLIAHELTHVAQQTASESESSGTLRRQLDPSNPAAWDWYDKEGHRKSPDYLKTVNAAGGAATDLSKKMSGGNAPTTDAEREAFEAQVLTLIRLNAVAMVGGHRNGLVERKRQFEEMAAKPPAVDSSQGKSGDSPSSGAADTAAAIRSAATMTTTLNARKERLDGLRSDISAAVRVNGGPETINDEYQTLWDKAQPDSAPSTLQRLLVARNQLAGDGLSWGTKKVVLMELRNDLQTFRTRQIQGVDSSLAALYNSFPFLADLPADEISTGKKKSKSSAFALGLSALSTVALPFAAPIAAAVAYDVFKKDEPPDDQELLASVQASFDRLIERTDGAIVKVGSGDIHPFDLPGAVAAARGSLPEPLRAELDKLREHREAMKFAGEMVLALGVAVLTGLTGGLAGLGLAAYAAGTGVAAAGIGAAQLGSQLKDMTDRQALAGAATSPDKALLGVSAPSTFEWAMLAVGAALTAADLAALAREIAALRPKFSEPARPPAATPEPHPTASGEPAPPAGSGHPNTQGEPPLGPPEAGKVRPSSASEARILEGGKGDMAPSLEQIDAELSIVQRTEPRKIPNTEYVEEVELTNGHTWRRTPDGAWCRFSNGKICVPGPRIQSAKDAVKTEADIDRLIETGPKLTSPPPSVTAQDQALWEMYNDYFTERVTSMRADIKTTGKTERDLPRTFESFKQQYTDNPELLKALRGRLAQGQTGNVIDTITEGKVAQNLGISKTPNPSPGEVVYPDFVVPRAKGGYSAVTSKSRALSETMTPEEVRKVVTADIREGLEKYYGDRYVRRRGLDQTGEKIRIDELVLNYDPTTVPEGIRSQMKEIGAAYQGVDVKIGFFDFK
jgi:predicted secreted Zn-dependent protease